MPHSLIRMVIQIHMRNFHFARRQRFRVHAKSMVLRRNLHLLRQQILHRVIRAVMPELQLERLPAQRQTAQLMPQANSENRHAPHQFPNIRNRVMNRLRISRPIRQKHPVRFQRQHVFCGSLRRNHGHVAVVIHQQSQNVLLNPEIVGHHPMPPALPAFRVRQNRRSNSDRSIFPFIFRWRTHPTGQFLPGHRGQRLRLNNQLLRRRLIRRHHAAQRTELPQVPHQRPRVHIPNHRNAMPLQIFLRRLRRPPVRGQRRKFAHHQAFDVRLGRFLVVDIRADVSDVRVGQANNLAGITGVGENFLVTGEAGIKNDFSAAARSSAGRTAVKYSSVFQRENRAPCLLLRQCVLQLSSS